MINMYSMGMYGMYGNMMGSMNSQNVPHYFKARYGEPEDFMTKPYPQGYPMAIIQRAPESNYTKQGLVKFINKHFK